MYLNNESTDYEFLRATRNSHLVLQSGGNNVGIGVTSPDNVLHVKHATTNVVAKFESGTITI